jgi:hypothetical protein
MEVDQLDNDSDTDGKQDATPSSNDADPNVLKLEAAIADLSKRTAAAELVLKAQAAAAALLDRRFDLCRELLAQQRSPSLRSHIDELQSTILKDIKVNDTLCKQLDEISQAPGPLEGRIVSLLESVRG